MRIAILVNDLATEIGNYTTTRLALECLRRDHEVWYLSAGDFVYAPDGRLWAAGAPVPEGDFEDGKDFLDAVRQEGRPPMDVCVEELDVLLLRNDPSDDARERPWAENVGIRFGRLAAERGVLVLNDPDGLSRAVDKLYLQLFPEEVRPRTLITRDVADVRAFADQEGPIVLKPLKGSGGESVFLVTPESRKNLNQIVDAIARHGYVIAQEYLPDASDSDTRLILMNGVPLQVDGEYAAIQRIGAEDDVRTNVSAGGMVAEAEVTDHMLELAELVRPRLVADGIFLAGLDIAGGRIMEINVFSPAGLGVARHATDKNFTAAVVEGIERKVAHRAGNGTSIPNAQMATL